jgi:pilus assembly protein CpaE
MAVEYGDAPAVQAPRSRYDVAVVEPDARQRMRLGTQLAGAAQFESIEELVQHLRPGRAIVAVFGPGLAVPYGFQQVHRLVASYPELGPVFAVDSVSTELLQSALRAGARDTVALGDGAALAQSVGRVGDLMAGVSPRVPAVPDSRGAPGRLVAVFSTKGGVGKSTIAINVAASMARRSNERVVLVDGDLQFGDVSVLLGLPPQQTVLDAAAAVQYGDTEVLRGLLSRHDSGLLVLPAPSEPILGSPLAPSDIVAVCDALRSLCAHTVVDLPTQFDDYVLAVIDAADDVLLVGSMDIPSVKNLKIGIHALDLQAIAGPKLRLVLNRANVQVKLDVREIEQVLGLRAEFPIPSDIAVPLSVNAGVPVVEYAPKSAASRALENIATSMLGSAAVAEPGKRRRGKRGRK